MLSHLIRAALNHRLLVIAIAAFFIVYGWLAMRTIPIDVFPDLNRPMVTVLTEAPGMAPEEVETLVSVPLEAALSGLPGVERIRSSSGVTLSIIYVEFSWGTDIYRDRQLVAEKLALAQGRLPRGISPVIGPVSSLMGEIQLIGLVPTNQEVTPMQLRLYADRVVRPRLLSVPGVTQIMSMGGEVKEYQILLSAQKVRYYQIPLEDIEGRLSHLSQNTTGGFITSGNHEVLVRTIGSVSSLEDIENSVVGYHLGHPVLVKDIASVKIGAQLQRGDASLNGEPAVLLAIHKQPNVNTLDLTRRINAALNDLEISIPPGIRLERDLVNQADFISQAIHNVQEVLRDGVLVVAAVLFLFLFNLRTTLISLAAIPLSFLLTFTILDAWGVTINTMTLGGLAIAIGELVDDAIVDVENILRRLRENRQRPEPLSALKVVFLASGEVRNSIVFATIIVLLVFLPLFQLEGLEGRLFIPLALAYVISLLSSLLVSLTVTPVLSYYLLSKAKTVERRSSWLVRHLQAWDRKLLSRAIDHPYVVLGGTGGLFLLALSSLFFLGTSFLPSFQEPTTMITVAAEPGTSLAASCAIGHQAEKIILAVPGVRAVSRRTGRAEEDEHAESVNASEIDVYYTEQGQKREEVLQEIRHQLAQQLPGVYVNVGAPMSHRIDYILSGVNSQIAIKLFGPNLGTLRRKASEIFQAVKDVKGLVDLQVEQQTLIPQDKIFLVRAHAAANGVVVGDLATSLETALRGKRIGQIMEDQQSTNVVLRFDEASRANLDLIKELSVKILPDGTRIPLKSVADIYEAKGPNVIQREHGRRRIVIQANVQGKDVGSLVGSMKKEISEAVKIPPDYFIKLGGQYESQQEASHVILLLGGVALIGIYFVLYGLFSSWWLSLQVMLSIPLAMIGALFAVLVTDRTLSIASLIGLTTLCGISSRNTIMMISHFFHLITHEHETFSKEMVIRGALERLVPVLMTSLTAMLGLSPLVFSSGAAGKEILHPLSVVIVGGLVSSTLLDLVVTPVVFFRFGQRASQKALQPKETL